ncbi:helix-turn-helix transcriptional regulator [Clostridium sp. AM58-1XD]|uniref:helix-turn-helix domain-containing protein n=1 Tax=Clostridium sp. AM58-1XD TaxID=2292307 RepID=UPI000E486505|nr:helix-turn-helix transcriptional regulator [Clostridium sp. AM58-1XD]RGZ00452.1 XRE family transcriptional regulator [Clostridium sp. AM58-1XD]
MSELTKEVGERLRAYRKMRGMTVEQLAKKIDRSNPTVYKYESGQISLDVDTIEAIAKVLKISPAFFFGTPETHTKAHPLIPFFDTNRLYTYYFDGRIKKQVKSLLTFYPDMNGDRFACSFYMNLADFSRPEQSRYLYSGRMISHETVSYFVMENITLPIESLTIQMIHPFQTSQTTWGIFMGLSDQPLAPMSTKMLFSKEPLSAQELSDYPLAFTKEEMKSIKNKNAILLSIRE